MFPEQLSSFRDNVKLHAWRQESNRWKEQRKIADLNPAGGTPLGRGVGPQEPIEGFQVPMFAPKVFWVCIRSLR